MPNFMKNSKEVKSDSHPTKDLSVMALQKCFHFILKALFVLKIFKFFSWFFYHV